MELTDKAKRGLEIYKTLPPWFNVYPVLTWDNAGCPLIDYEALADWFAAKQEQSHDTTSR